MEEGHCILLFIINLNTIRLDVISYSLFRCSFVYLDVPKMLFSYSIVPSSFEFLLINYYFPYLVLFLELCWFIKLIIIYNYSSFIQHLLQNHYLHNKTYPYCWEGWQSSFDDFHFTTLLWNVYVTYHEHYDLEKEFSWAEFCEMLCSELLEFI